MITWRKKLSLCGPVKTNLSTTSTGSIGVVCACTWISANDVSRSFPIDDRRYVFSLLRVEKERSGVVEVTGKWRAPAAGWIGLDRGMHCMLCMHPVQSWVVPLQQCSMSALLPQLKLGSELVVTIVNERQYISTAGSRAWNTYWLVSISALQIGVPLPWSSTNCNDLSVSASVIKACTVFCFCTHAPTQGISRWQRFNFKL